MLEVDGGVIGGRLRMEWSYSRGLHRRETMEKLARGYMEALRSLIAHCRTNGARGYDSSNFTEFGWSQQDVEDILAELGKKTGSQ